MAKQVDKDQAGGGAQAMTAEQARQVLVAQEAEDARAFMAELEELMTRRGFRLITRQEWTNGVPDGPVRLLPVRAPQGQQGQGG